MKEFLKELAIGLAFTVVFAVVEEIAKCAAEDLYYFNVRQKMEKKKSKKKKKPTKKKRK